MSILRRIKLRTPDGIESIEYPLGVEAKNVEVANQENLSQRLVRIDEDLEENKEDIATVNELAGANRQNIGANEIRIDALERRSASIDKKPYYFDTVADMKAYQGSKVGDMAITLGYYEVNDGGGAEYKIVQSSNKYVETLNNNLKAELIIKGDFIPEQFGAKGDGITDDINIFNIIFNLMENNSQLLLTKTYLISEPLYLPNKNNIVISGGTFKASPNFNGYILNSNLNTATGYSGWNYATENLTLENVFIDGSYTANGLYLDNYLRVKIISCTFHNFKDYGIYLNNGHEAQIIGTNLIGRTYGDTEIANIGIYIGCHDNIVDSCIIAHCQWAVDIREAANQICNSHFYCNRLNGGNIKARTSQLLFDNNYFDGSGVYLINPWETTFSNNTFNLTASTHHIIKLDTDISGQINIKGIYITNTIVRDNRNSTTILDLIECTFNPTNVENCYIDKINNPTYVNINNPYNIFSFKNNDNPIIIEDGIFRATNKNHTIGEHLSLDNFYEYKYNSNFIRTNYIGSTSVYPWLFFKIYVPEKMRIQRNMVTLSVIDFFDENENYISSNKATLEKGYYWVGIYRTVDLYLATN